MSKTTRRNTLRLEALEAREVMTASIVNGTLAITGTRLADTVQVTVQDRVVWVREGTTITTFAASRVTNGMTFHGGDGNDSINNLTSIPLFADGGAGNDVLRGGTGNDTLRGGYGNDRLFGNQGTDRLFGDAGDDFLDGGAFDAAQTALHTFDGGTGSDFLSHRPVVGGATFSDVDQGASLTSGVLAAISATAKQGVDFASRISRVGHGIYSVNLFVRYGTGFVTKAVVVGFDGVTSAADPKPHARGQEGEFWVTVVHRAYLELHPTAVLGGSVASALEAFSGRKADARTKVGSWFEGMDTPAGRVAGNPDHLRNLLAAGKAVVATTGPATPLLIGNMAYAVTKVERVGGAWFVELYNPHGTDGGTLPRGDATDGVVRLNWSEFNAGVVSYTFA